MDDNICEQCGTRNEPGAQFCVECQAFLPWYDTRETNLAGARHRYRVRDGPGRLARRRRTDRAGCRGGAGHRRQRGARRSRCRARPADVSRPPSPPRMIGRPATPRVAASAARRPEAADQVRVAIEPASAEVVPGGDEVSVDVQIYNLSPIVDAYRVTAPDAPAWLTVGAAEVRLLPNSNELATIRLQNRRPAPWSPLVARGCWCGCSPSRTRSWRSTSTSS